MTFCRSISMAIRSPMLEPNWLPNCVARPDLAAAAVIARASQTSWAIGFWQKTCLPAASAAMLMSACMWSGTVDVDRIDAAAFPLQHFPPVGVGPRVRRACGGRGQEAGIDVADGHNLGVLAV